MLCVCGAVCWATQPHIDSHIGELVLLALVSTLCDQFCCCASTDSSPCGNSVGASAFRDLRMSGQDCIGLLCVLCVVCVSIGLPLVVCVLPFDRSLLCQAAAGTSLSPCLAIALCRLPCMMQTDSLHYCLSVCHNHLRVLYWLSYILVRIFLLSFFLLLSWLCSSSCRWLEWRSQCARQRQ